MSGHHQHHHRLHASPSPGLLHHISLPIRSLHRTRPPTASFRTHLPRPPQSLPSPFPKKRSDHEAAADFGELGGAVADDTTEAAAEQLEYGDGVYTPSVGAAGLPALLRAGRAGPAGDPVFFLLTAVAVTTSVAFSSMVAVAIPTMLAMRRAANSFTMLADAALEELPSTMAAIRLSGMEVTDLTLGLSDLSHEIADGVNKSAKVAQAVEAGMGQMQDIAMSMIKERASLQTIPTAGPDNRSHKSSGQQGRRERGANT
ncbi:uncharacterized protein LOC8054117 isoform X2 [Sorghum bicolor]|nr:uncharacterized protein LOC8054117 isoform X2 [Sorghum bicolor]KXG23151.1 hypothetical protein SORBI_3008G063200 [Sorghum bicolor]|eukprot:XP_002442947.2 uncharacterized protein LOC8054117 isoform X2 [Sorghum bicolor]